MIREPKGYRRARTRNAAGAHKNRKRDGCRKAARGRSYRGEW